ncbi:MAG: 30S ribosomal protein THX [Bacteroidetes bacterium]|jgi:30S ribosomal protein S31|nr:30S ribosomal protein THX [Bacteroidota bacterium]
MGKGDKKTRRGKIVMGSYGVRRPRKNATTNAIAVTEKISAKKIAKKAVK